MRHAATVMIIAAMSAQSGRDGTTAQTAPWRAMGGNAVVPRTRTPADDDVVLAGKTMQRDCGRR